MHSNNSGTLTITTDEKIIRGDPLVKKLTNNRKESNNCAKVSFEKKAVNFVIIYLSNFLPLQSSFSEPLKKDGLIRSFRICKHAAQLVCMSPTDVHGYILNILSNCDPSFYKPRACFIVISRNNCQFLGHSHVDERFP